MVSTASMELDRQTKKQDLYGVLWLKHHTYLALGDGILSSCTCRNSIVHQALPLSTIVRRSWRATRSPSRCFFLSLSHCQSTCEILQERGKLIGLNFWLGRYYRAELYKTSSQLVITYYLLLFIARYEYQNRPTSDERRAIIDIYSSGSWRMRRPKSPNATAINNGFHKTESCDSLSQLKCQ